MIFYGLFIFFLNDVYNFTLFLRRGRMIGDRHIHSACTWRLEVDTEGKWYCLLQQDLGRYSCAGLICRPLFQWLRTNAWVEHVDRDGGSRLSERGEEVWMCDHVEKGPSSWCGALKPTLGFMSSAYLRFHVPSYGCHLREVLILNDFEL